MTDPAPPAPVATLQPPAPQPPAPQPPATPPSVFPLNRVVAFAGPVLSLLAGAAASWLGGHVPGLHLDTKAVAGQITQGLEFLAGALVTFALQNKWLSGWQAWEARSQPPPAAAPPAAGPQPQPMLPPLFPLGEYDPARDMPPALPTAAAHSIYPAQAFLAEALPDAGTPSDG